MTSAPSAATRLDQETAQEIFRRHVHGQSDAKIAREVHVSRNTVKRVTSKALSALATLQPVENERARALATYREMLRIGWESVDRIIANGRSPTMLLGELRLIRQRIDVLLGLEAMKPEIVEIHTFTHTVASLIREESPELADKLAGRLMDIRNGVGVIDG